MPEDYEKLVAAMKTLSQEGVTLPMVEDGWNTRPDTVSYGIIQLEFEPDALHGDNIKVAAAYEGSVDLYSLQKKGAGWIGLITGTLTEYCGGAWRLNHRAYERDTGLWHWEWVFQIGE